ETDYFALFCTWPAPEMPRPGCVWSHVLLIDLADLARIPDLSVLPDLCVRPTISKGFSEYEKPLFTFLPDVITNRAPKNLHLAACVLEALYGQPNSSVVLFDEESKSWVPIVFALWSQQWPRLRRNFAFSTGSLGDRRLAGTAFDLQIAPLISERLWRRSGADTILLNSSSKSVTNLPSLWVADVVDDLMTGTNTSLRQFLFSFGSDIEKPRHAFASLVSAYKQLRNNKDWADKLLFIAKQFPDQSDALRLKESL